LHRPGTSRHKAKLNHSQISANFTPNCFAEAVAVVSAKVGRNIAEKSAKFFHFCTIWSIELNSAQVGQFCTKIYVYRIAESRHP